ncbi:MAG: hypothetical protein CSA81_00285 [Acidobacteria bacterium]|nr:MAG: hypothetical protein CSA81_00285 [Acidobacteriota bacterium]
MDYALSEQQSTIIPRQVNEDRELIRRFLEGDETAFTLIVNKYRRYIYGMTYRFVQNQAEADDLTQETFIKAFQNLKKFRQETPQKQGVQAKSLRLAFPFSFS